MCRATVGPPAAPERITLFRAADAEPAPLTLASLAPLLAQEAPGVIGALVRESAEGRVDGHVEVDIGAEHEARAGSVAAATAVMKASWGWDESPTIAVSVNGATIHVAPRFSGDGWTAAGIESPAV